MNGAISLDGIPRPGVAIPTERWTELLAAEAERDRLRDALKKIIHGGYAEGSDRAHPAIALARDTLNQKS